MRALIIEDEIKTGTYLHNGLRENSWDSDVALDGEEGLRLALAREYDLVILDVILPLRDGWSVITEMRNESRLTPVLFLTARDAVGERVKGLDLGADDYLVKPFAFSELLARIRSMMRRGPERQPASLRIADLEIDLINHRATRAGVRLDLTSKEFALLVVFARSSGEVLSRKLIAERVWEMSLDTDTNLIDVAVRRLRRKVEGPFSKPLIYSVYGIGYVLEER
jgi:two-component system, OmpR family, copper resistance phosphate regulon response regulator CusR